MILRLAVKKAFFLCPRTIRNHVRLPVPVKTSRIPVGFYINGRHQMKHTGRPETSTLPPSASSFIVNVVAGCAYIAAVHTGLARYGVHDQFLLGLCGLFATGMTLLLGEIFFLKTC